MECKCCGSCKIKKNGKSLGKQRYKCKECGKAFFDTEPKFSEVLKQKAILMYLNNGGVRKTAMFIGCVRTTMTNWVKKAKEKLSLIFRKRPILLSWTKYVHMFKKTEKINRMDCLF